METIKGKLDPFFETGTEGVVWSVYEDGKEGYDGLHCLYQGDYLTVFDPDDTTKVIWEGNIDLEYERNYRPYPMNPQYGQQEALGYWVHGFQKDVEPETWATWFFKAYPSTLIKSKIGHLYRCKSSTIAGYRWDGQGSSWRPEAERVPGDLIIKFNNGTFYKYKNVDYDTANGFMDAESRGKYFAANIKDKFEFERLDLPRPVGYSTNKPGPRMFPTNETHGKPHGADVEAAWPFPTYNKP